MFKKKNTILSQISSQLAIASKPNTINQLVKQQQSHFAEQRVFDEIITSTINVNKKILPRTEERFDSVPKFKRNKYTPQMKKKDEKQKKYYLNSEKIREKNFERMRDVERNLERRIIGTYTYLNVDAPILNNNDSIENDDKKDDKLKHLDNLRLKTQLMTEKENELVNVSYAPLNQDEIKFAKKFYNEKDYNYIIQGGRSVLKREIENIISFEEENREEESNIEDTNNDSEIKEPKNKDNSEDIVNQKLKKLLKPIYESEEYRKIVNELISFEQIDIDDIVYLKNNYKQLCLDNHNVFNLILHEGKKMITSLRALSVQKAGLKNALENLMFATDYTSLEIKSKSIADNVNLNYKIPETIREVLDNMNIDQDQFLNSLKNNSSFNRLFERQSLDINNFDFEFSDISLIKGLSANKARNLPFDCYIDYSPHEDLGIRVFKLKKNITANGYLSFDRSEHAFDEERLTFRCTVKFINKSNKEMHFALFDNEILYPKNKYQVLTIPFPHRFKFLNYNENNWKLVDVDNSSSKGVSLLPTFAEYDLLNLSNFWEYDLNIDILKIMNAYYNNVNYFPLSKAISNKKSSKVTKEADADGKAPKNEKEGKAKSKKNAKEEQNSNSSTNNANNKDLNNDIDESKKADKSNKYDSLFLFEKYKIHSFPDFSENITSFLKLDPYKDSIFSNKKQSIALLQKLSFESSNLHHFIISGNIMGLSVDEVNTIFKNFLDLINNYFKNNTDTSINHDKFIITAKSTLKNINPFLNERLANYFKDYKNIDINYIEDVQKRLFINSFYKRTSKLYKNDKDIIADRIDNVCLFLENYFNGSSSNNETVDSNYYNVDMDKIYLLSQVTDMSANNLNDVIRDKDNYNSYKKYVESHIEDKQVDDLTLISEIIKENNYYREKLKANQASPTSKTNHTNKEVLNTQENGFNNWLISLFNAPNSTQLKKYSLDLIKENKNEIINSILNKEKKRDPTYIGDLVEKSESTCNDFHLNYDRVAGKDNREITFNHKDYYKAIATTIEPIEHNEENAKKYLSIKYPLGGVDVLKAKYPLFNELINIKHEIEIMNSIDSYKLSPKRYSFKEILGDSVKKLH